MQEMALTTVKICKSLFAAKTFENMCQATGRRDYRRAVHTASHLRVSASGIGVEIQKGIDGIRENTGEETAVSRPLRDLRRLFRRLVADN